MRRAATILFIPSFMFLAFQDITPEGKIAFLGLNGDSSSVYITNKQNSVTKRVTHDSINVSDFTISPDGNKLAVTIDGDLFILNISSGSMKKLTHNRRAYSPKWSPNGNHIAFSDRFGEYAELCVIDTAGLLYRRLTPFHTSSGNISSTWSPDGKEIAFQGIGYDLFIVNVDEPAQIRQITNTGNDKKRCVGRKFPAWSPNGEYIAYYGEDHQCGLLKNGIYIVNTDGSNPKLILEIKYRSIMSWSPDSKHLACELMRNGRNDIYIINLKGEIVKKLTNSNRRNFQPSWSLH